MNKIEELCEDKPVDEEHLYRVGEHLIIVSNEAAVRSKDSANIDGPCTKCRAYQEEREIQENIATLYTQETTLRENMLTWHGEMGVQMLVDLPLPQ
jgi:hypothetical protein